MWLVCDMDRTLVDKPPQGGYPTIQDGPCFDAASRWLDAGHCVAVVTTDAGLRPFAAVWDCFSPRQRAGGRLVLALADGAALYYGDAEGELVQDDEYASSALQGNRGVASVPGLPPQHMPALLDIARDIQLAYFDDVLTDPSLLESQGPRESHYYPMILQRVIRAAMGKQPLHGGAAAAAATPEEESEVAAKIEAWPRLSPEAALRIVRDEAAKERGDEPIHIDPADTELLNQSRAQLRELFTLENLLSMRGALKERGSLIWRNEVGPMTAESIGRMEDKDCDAVFTSCIVMNIPRSIASKYMAQLDVERRLDALGLASSPAPNSLWLKNPAVDKSLPVQYMLRNSERFHGFRLDEAIAFGDNPAGNDEPLTRFDEDGGGMAFVSVAGTVDECPEALLARHVGGFEYGTAAVVQRVLDALLDHPPSAQAAAPAAGDGGLRGVLDSVLDACREGEDLLASSSSEDAASTAGTSKL